MKSVDDAMSRAVLDAYRRGEDDETMLPLVRVGKDGRAVGRIKAGDGVIFYNIRGEREAELTRALTDPHFDAFPVVPGLSLLFATMVEYDNRLNLPCAFPPEGELRDTLCEVFSAKGFKQAKVTEAEKAMHVSFFLNGKRMEPFPGEDRIIVPTRKDVVLFDEAPRMSIDYVVQAAITVMRDPSYRFIFVNFPNVDVVGHIENERAVLEAVSAVDEALGAVVDEARAQGITVVITADHGTVEQWRYPDGKIDTGHTTNSVPFILIHPNGNVRLRPGGSLIDVAPTVLHLFGIEAPTAMTGTSLIVGDVRHPAQRIVLILLDGWGEGIPGEGNMIARAATPVMDGLTSHYPTTTLAAAEEAVGLPSGTVGNSEAGHLHIGAGRVVLADRVRIDRAIDDGTFFTNPLFQEMMGKVKTVGQALHLMGIVSFFSSHGSLHHLYALMEMAKREGLPEVYIHAMLGRRGERPESGARYVGDIEERCRRLKVGQVVSVIGRYWSMDREENWDRIEKTYRMLVFGEGRPVR